MKQACLHLLIMTFTHSKYNYGRVHGKNVRNKTIFKSIYKRFDPKQKYSDCDSL